MAVPQIIRTCEQCGIVFAPSTAQSIAQRKRQRFCSANCRKQWRREHPPATRRIRRTCEWCGIEFAPKTGSVYARQNQRFCSYLCSNGRTRETYRTFVPDADRFWEKAEHGTIPAYRPDLAPCWQWTAFINNDGYGIFGVYQAGPIGAHRWAYRYLIGEVPPGLELDHLCRNRACVNPLHLEPVTKRENVLRGMSSFAQKARQTHCKRGHPFDEANTRRVKNGLRACRACALASQRQRTRGAGSPNTFPP